MTREFIEAHCVNCDYCIWEDKVPSFCGEIDEGGCRSTELKLVSRCREGHEPIPHIPKYNVGDRIYYSPFVCKIIGIDGEKYILQRECSFGKFNEPWPTEKWDIEETDECYELYEDQEDADSCLPAEDNESDPKICTSMEQSKILLDLGLDPKTADMWYHPDYSYDNIPDLSRRCRVENIPAWSLSKLLRLLPDVIKQGDDCLTFSLIKNVIEYCNSNGEAVYSAGGDCFVDAAVEMFQKIGI